MRRQTIGLAYPKNGLPSEGVISGPADGLRAARSEGDQKSSRSGGANTQGPKPQASDESAFSDWTHLPCMSGHVTMSEPTKPKQKSSTAPPPFPYTVNTGGEWNPSAGELMDAWATDVMSEAVSTGAGETKLGDFYRCVGASVVMIPLGGSQIWSGQRVFYNDAYPNLYSATCLLPGLLEDYTQPWNAEFLASPWSTRYPGNSTAPDRNTFTEHVLKVDWDVSYAPLSTVFSYPEDFKGWDGSSTEYNGLVNFWARRALHNNNGIKVSLRMNYVRNDVTLTKHVLLDWIPMVSIKQGWANERLSREYRFSTLPPVVDGSPNPNYLLTDVRLVFEITRNAPLPGFVPTAWETSVPDPNAFSTAFQAKFFASACVRLYSRGAENALRVNAPNPGTTGPDKGMNEKLPVGLYVYGQNGPSPGGRFVMRTDSTMRYASLDELQNVCQSFGNVRYLRWDGSDGFDGGYYGDLGYSAVIRNSGLFVGADGNKQLTKSSLGSGSSSTAPLVILSKTSGSTDTTLYFTPEGVVGGWTINEPNEGWPLDPDRDYLIQLDIDTLVVPSRVLASPASGVLKVTTRYEDKDNNPLKVLDVALTPISTTDGVSQFVIARSVTFTYQPNQGSRLATVVDLSALFASGVSPVMVLRIYSQPTGRDMYARSIPNAKNPGPIGMTDSNAVPEALKGQPLTKNEVVAGARDCAEVPWWGASGRPHINARLFHFAPCYDLDTDEALPHSFDQEKGDRRAAGNPAVRLKPKDPNREDKRPERPTVLTEREAEEVLHSEKSLHLLKGDSNVKPARGASMKGDVNAMLHAKSRIINKLTKDGIVDRYLVLDWICSSRPRSNWVSFVFAEVRGKLGYVDFFIDMYVSDVDPLVMAGAFLAVWKIEDDMERSIRSRAIRHWLDYVMFQSGCSDVGDLQAKMVNVPLAFERYSRKQGNPVVVTNLDVRQWSDTCVKLILEADLLAGEVKSSGEVSLRVNSVSGEAKTGETVGCVVQKFLRFSSSKPNDDFYVVSGTSLVPLDQPVEHGADYRVFFKLLGGSSAPDEKVKEPADAKTSSGLKSVLRDLVPAFKAANVSYSKGWDMEKFRSSYASLSPGVLRVGDVSADNIQLRCVAADGTQTLYTATAPERGAYFRRYSVGPVNSVNRLTSLVLAGSFSARKSPFSFTATGQLLSALSTKQEGVRPNSVGPDGWRSTDSMLLMSFVQSSDNVATAMDGVFTGTTPDLNLLRLALFFVSCLPQVQRFPRSAYYYGVPNGVPAINVTGPPTIAPNAGVAAFGETLAIDVFPATSGAPVAGQGGRLQFWQHLNNIPPEERDRIVVVPDFIMRKAGDNGIANSMLAYYLMMFTPYPLSLVTHSWTAAVGGAVTSFIPFSSSMIVKGGVQVVHVLLPIIAASAPPNNQAAANANLVWRPRETRAGNLVDVSWSEDPLNNEEYSLVEYINSWAYPPDLNLMLDVMRESSKVLSGSVNAGRVAVEIACALACRYRPPTTSATREEVAVTDYPAGDNGILAHHCCEGRFGSLLPAGYVWGGGLDISGQANDFVFPEMTLMMANSLVLGWVMQGSASIVKVADATAETKTSEPSPIATPAGISSNVGCSPEEYATYIRYLCRRHTIVFDVFRVLMGVPTSFWRFPVGHPASEYYRMVQRLYSSSGGDLPQSRAWEHLSLELFGGEGPPTFTSGANLFNSVVMPGNRDYCGVVVGNAAGPWIRVFDSVSTLLPDAWMMAPKMVKWAHDVTPATLFPRFKLPSSAMSVSALAYPLVAGAPAVRDMIAIAYDDPTLKVRTNSVVHVSVGEREARRSAFFWKMADATFQVIAQSPTDLPRLFGTDAAFRSWVVPFGLSATDPQPLPANAAGAITTIFSLVAPDWVDDFVAGVATRATLNLVKPAVDPASNQAPLAYSTLNGATPFSAPTQLARDADAGPFRLLGTEAGDASEFM